jgi:hypothetical protein
VRIIQLSESDCLSDEQTGKLAGRKLDESHFDILASREDVEVRKPGGELLLKLCYNRISPDVCRAAYGNIREAARVTDNRGMAGGLAEDGERSTRKRRVVKLKDGTQYLSNTTEAVVPVHSGIIGYFDRYQRNPYCRQTAYNLDNPDKFRQALPFITQVSEVFRAECPERYENQRRMIERTNPDFYIKGTVFTTITVNRNFQTAVHTDRGDLKEGFGVMTALRGGKYDGAFLVFPKFRVAADMRTGDVLLADVHEWHGNTPFKGVPGKFERISCVFYYRRKMVKCKSAVEELELAKNRKKGQPLYEDGDNEDSES